MTTIKDILTELCKRGCMIEIKNGYPIDHLPKSLVTTNDNIIDPNYCDSIVEFKISSIVHNFTVYFVKLYNLYQSNWCRLYSESSLNYYIVHNLDCKRDHKKIMENLDFLTHYLYTKGNIQILYTITDGTLIQNNIYPDTIISYSENLRAKMISSLIKDGILGYLQAIDNVFPIEIKMIFINMFMKLDNWHNVGLYMKFGV